jgi:hypothetical protein
MGDCKPSQFLRHLRSLAPDVPDDFLHSIWSSQFTSSMGLNCGNNTFNLTVDATPAIAPPVTLSQPTI